MKEPSGKIDTVNYTELSRVIGWYISLRWIACLGVLFSLLSAKYFFLYRLEYFPLFFFNALLAGLNLAYLFFFRSKKNNILSRKTISVFFHSQILLDYLILFALVYFSGFLENPFSVYFVFHIILTSYIFSKNITRVYAALLTVFISFAAALCYSGFLPYFSLGFAVPAPAYVFLKAAGLCSMILILAYLSTEIKERIEEKGRKTEIDLEWYKNIDRMKSDFLLQVTHELRGPLAAVKGYHEVILKGLRTEISVEVNDLITKADRRLENLLAIINEMLDYAYMREETHLKYRENRIKLKELLENNLELQAQAARRKNIKFSYSCPEELEMEANRDLLNIILGNLISNAVKYSGEGQTVYVGLEKIKQEIHILVKDEGMGIEPENLEKIFEEFFRTPEAKKIIRDGTGLGLSIVKKAVTRLDGRLEVYSEKNKGSAFHVFIKAEKAAA